MEGHAPSRKSGILALIVIPLLLIGISTAWSFGRNFTCRQCSGGFEASIVDPKDETHILDRATCPHCRAGKVDFWRWLTMEKKGPALKGKYFFYE